LSTRRQNLHGSVRRKPCKSPYATSTPLIPEVEMRPVSKLL